MKLFILEGSRGSYDDYTTWAEGVFSTIEKLEEYKQKYVENIERIKQLPCPIDQEIYDQQDWYDKVSDEDWELVDEWETKVNDVKDINNYRTIELELDPEFKQ